MTTVETDYLIVGAGVSGMAFADSLIAESDADVVIMDRRHRPGGHSFSGCSTESRRSTISSGCSRKPHKYGQRRPRNA